MVHIGRVKADAVGGEDLSVCISAVDVVVVIVRGGVGLLDASARWGIIPGHGDADAGIVAEEEGLLHKALAKGAAANYESAVVVLDGAGKNFAGRCRTLPYQNGEAHVQEGAATIGPENFALAVDALNIDDGVPCGQEIVAHEKGLVHVAAGVGPEVDEEVFHALLLQLARSVVHLFESGAGELPYPHVGHGVAEHKRRVNAVDGDFSTGDFKGNLFLCTPDRNGDLGAGGAFHEADHAVLRELDAGYYAVIDLDYAVTFEEAGLFRRAAGYDFKDDGGVRRNVELYAYAVEASGKLLLRV